MMQDGLHIGLAAWINLRRGNDSFPVYPASPIASELVNLEAVQTSSDLAKAAEFARLVNFVPRQGQPADVFSPSAPLWEVHRDVLSRMRFATQAWTDAEKAQYQAARAVLYTTDASGLPTPTDKHQIYTELKNAYEDLRNSGGSQAEIDEALANWSAMGFKDEVEHAFNVIATLQTHSTSTEADFEESSLDPRFLRVSGDLPFAPTYFAPLSALSRQTWLAARASFSELDDAVGEGAARGSWQAYRSNRSGEVSFDYAIVSCLRPWFTPALYKADDWKITPDGSLVSQGNGVDGELAAYVDAVYLVSVTNVTVDTTPPPPKPTHRPPIRILGTAAATSIEAPRLERLVVQPKALNLATSRVALSTRTDTSAGSTSNRLNTGALDARFTAVHLGSVRKLNILDVNTRYTLAQAYLAGQRPPVVSTPAAETSVYVAGFGCSKIPFAPNPNANYVWS